MDILENHPILYERKLKKFVTEAGTVQEAWVYLLQRYKPEMLELEFYESYESNGSHGKVYVPRYKRAQGISSPDDL